jgi:hypothetical protein
VLNLLFPPREKELSMGARVDAKPPVDRFSMKGFRKGMQATRIARLSWMVVAR